MIVPAYNPSTYKIEGKRLKNSKFAVLHSEIISGNGKKGKGEEGQEKRKEEKREGGMRRVREPRRVDGGRLPT